MKKSFTEQHLGTGQSSGKQSNRGAVHSPKYQSSDCPSPCLFQSRMMHKTLNIPRPLSSLNLFPEQEQKFRIVKTKKNVKGAMNRKSMAQQQFQENAVYITPSIPNLTSNKWMYPQQTASQFRVSRSKRRIHEAQEYYFEKIYRSATPMGKKTTGKHKRFDFSKPTDRPTTSLTNSDGRMTA